MQHSRKYLTKIKTKYSEFEVINDSQPSCLNRKQLITLGKHIMVGGIYYIELTQYQTIKWWKMLKYFCVNVQKSSPEYVQCYCARREDCPRSTFSCGVSLPADQYFASTSHS